MKAAQLRQSILQAAVQGKLVPQNVHDEPASKLLARIRTEKAQLVKEGKIKKEKSLPPITEDDVPYDLPDGWVWCRLGDVVTIKSSKRIYESDYVSDGIPFYRSKEIGDLSRGESIATKFYITKEKYMEIKTRFGVPQRGDILVTSVGTIGNCWVSDGRDFYYKDGNVTQILATDNIIENYLLLYLRSPLFFLQALGTVAGTAYGALTIIKFNNVIFPVPPIAEQQRIVAKVDEFMALCDELEAAEKELDKLEADFAEHLPKSILQAAVQGKLVPQNIHDEPADKLLERIHAEKVQLIKDGKIKKEKPLPPIAEDDVPYDLPDGWVWCRLGEACNIIMGQSPDGNSVTDNGQGLEFHQGKSYFSQIYLNTSPKTTNQPTKIVETGDVLLAVRAPVGVVNITPRCICIGRGLCALQPPTFLDSKFIFYFMQTMEEYFNIQATGTTFIAISAEIVKNALFPLPPLAEQQRIVAKVDELMTLCDELKTARDISTASTMPKVIPFPSQEDAEIEEIRMAARGDVQGLSDEAMRDVDELFGDDAND